MEQSSGDFDKDKIELILSAKFKYYKKLNPEDQKKFVDRTYLFANNKEFLTRDAKDILDEMDNIKTLISAAAIELTFGLSEYELPHFSKIFIYPHDYYNGLTKHWHKGETNIMGAIVFSWKDFQEAYNEEHGKTNLGLHEMAHALLLTDKIDEGRDAFFDAYFDRWWAISSTEFKKLAKHETSFFRDYGGTNQQEFFAVCMECFFEASQEFKEKHPEIYRQTCILLNQDPSGDFSKITEAREELLKSFQNIDPGILIYRTKGRTLMNTVLSSGGIGVYLFFTFFLFGRIDVIQHIFIWGLSAALIVFLVIRLVKYKEFYVYDNAFAIGYERHGEDLEKMDVIGAPLCVSITFRTIYHYRSIDSHVIELMHIDDGNLTKTEWTYNHIKSGQVEELKNAVKDFCAKNYIGFHLDPQN